MVNLPILATRGSNGLVLYQGNDAFNKNDVLFKEEAPAVRVMEFSEDGSLLAYVAENSVKVMNLQDGTTLFETAKPKTVEMTISTNNRYLATWETFYTTPGNTQGNNNFEIVDMKSKTVVKSMIHKKQTGWKPIWSKDEKICGRCVNNEVQFYAGGEFHTAATKLYLQGVGGFSISPSKSAPYMVAAFVAGKKGQPSFVRLFEYPNFGDGQALANKSFFKADKVDMIWNKKSTALLILVSSEVDTTGSSYYGEQSLHFMSTKGESNLVHFDKRGPIYCVDWNPNSSQFCVVYGYMPAKATLFDMKCEVLFDFGTGPRNICTFNPHGNILCLAGFGNLNGYMEMWNVDGRKMVAKPQATDTTHMEWCPDGQHIVTATCAPRLRVGNGFKIWHYTGKVLYKYDVPKQTELWQAKWQTHPEGIFPVPKIVTGVQEAPKAQAYRPPSARGTAEKKLVIHEDELPQNQRKNQDNLSAAAKKNKKKREAAKAKAQQEPAVVNGASKCPTPAPIPEVASTGDPDIDKKIKAIKKKLRQIDDLKAKRKDGTQLEKNQLDKLSSEASLLKELQSLQIS
jgi:translation initiation factor 2A